MKASSWNPNSTLTIGLSEEDKKLIQDAFVYAKPLVERLRSLLLKELDKSIEQTDDISKYESPNWAHLQSFISGQRSSLRYLLKLLKNK